MFIDIRFIHGYDELRCRLAGCALLGQRRNGPRWTMGGLRQGGDSSDWTPLRRPPLACSCKMLLSGVALFTLVPMPWQHSITPLRGNCHGRCQCDPKNMGENITIFFKKGILIH